MGLALLEELQNDSAHALLGVIGRKGLTLNQLFAMHREVEGLHRMKTLQTALRLLLEVLSRRVQKHRATTPLDRRLLAGDYGACPARRSPRATCPWAYPHLLLRLPLPGLPPRILWPPACPSLTRRPRPRSADLRYRADIMDRNGSNMILALADYLDDNHLSELPLLATRVLTNVCQFAAKQGAQSLLACLGTGVERLSDVIIFLVEHKRSSVALRVALLEFVEQAVSTQVGLTRLLLGVQSILRRADDAKKSRARPAKPSMLDAIVDQELRDGRLTDRLRADPDLAQAVLKVIRQLWTVKASQLRRRMEQWEGVEFWKELSRPLVEFERPVAPPSHGGRELTRWVQQTQTMSFILDVCGAKAFEVNDSVEERKRLAALGIFDKARFVDNLGVDKWISGTEYRNGTEATAQLAMAIAWCKFVSICTSRLLPPEVSRDLLLQVAQRLEVHTGFLSNHLTQKFQDLNTSMVAAEEAYDASDEYARVAILLGDLLCILLRSAGGPAPASAAGLLETLTNALARVLEVTPLCTSNAVGPLTKVRRSICTALLSITGAWPEDCHSVGAYTVDLVLRSLDLTMGSQGGDVEPTAGTGDAEALEEANVVALTLLNALTRCLPVDLIGRLLLEYHGVVEVLLRSYSTQIQSQGSEALVVATGNLILGLSMRGKWAALLALGRTSIGTPGGLACHLTTAAAHLRRQPLPLYTKDGRPNVWHRQWCHILTVFSRCLDAVGHESGFLQDTLEFVQLQAGPLLAAFQPLERNLQQMQPSLGNLIEAEAVSALFRSLSRHADHWIQSMPTILQPDGLLSSVARLLQRKSGQRLAPNLDAAALPPPPAARGLSPPTRRFAPALLQCVSTASAATSGSPTPASPSPVTRTSPSPSRSRWRRRPPPACAGWKTPAPPRAARARASRSLSGYAHARRRPPSPIMPCSAAAVSELATFPFPGIASSSPVRGPVMR